MVNAGEGLIAGIGMPQVSLHLDPPVSSDANKCTESGKCIFLSQWTPELPEAFALLGFSFYVQPIVSLAGHATCKALPSFEPSCFRVHRCLIAIVVRGEMKRCTCLSSRS